MCQPNCSHSKLCEYNGTGYECDLNNDSAESMCGTCESILLRKTVARLDNQSTEVLRSPEYVANRSVKNDEPKREDNGFLSLLDCDGIVGFHVFQDDELADLLQYKCDNDVDWLNLTLSSSFSSP